VELSWWPVALAGFACLPIAVVMASLLPMEQVRRQLRPLAHTSRLTRLPEYARLARTRLLAMIVTIILLLVVFVSAVLASARPTGWSWEAGSEVPQDTMLCVGEPVTAPATGEFLAYFAGQAQTSGIHRIGLTSPTRRVVPMTRDDQYAAGRFGDFARITQQPDVVTKAEAAEFAPAVTYVDYAPSVDDVLALCMTGFPSFEQKSNHRRSLIYLGPSSIRAPDETRPALFADQRVTDMANDAGIRIDAITTSPRGREATLRSVTESTGGKFFYYNPDNSTLSADLDAIRNDPPPAALPGGAGVVGWSSDSPAIPLIVAVVAAALLCVSLAVMRR
jgi:hypothetical protein